MRCSCFPPIHILPFQFEIQSRVFAWRHRNAGLFGPKLCRYHYGISVVVHLFLESPQTMQYLRFHPSTILSRVHVDHAGTACRSTFLCSHSL